MQKIFVKSNYNSCSYNIQVSFFEDIFKENLYKSLYS